jgi:transcriptional regulator with XRE-family HTH domain
MADSTSPTLSDAAHREVASRLREEIARRRLSREKVAADAKISLSTLEKALSGKRPFTLATLVRLETALGLTLRPASNGGPAAAVTAGDAPDELGSYNRASVAWLEGSYLTLRPSFSDPASVYAYRTDIFWDEPTTRLHFREANRVDTDFTQFGEVSVAPLSGYVYLLTNRHGQIRLAIISRPTITGDLHGVITTLQATRGSQLTPVSMPLALQPLNGSATASYGRIDPQHPDYDRYRRLLRKSVTDEFVKFISV